MESKKHKESRLKDGGIHSSNCKCGRPWVTRWISRMAYHRICPGCKKRTKFCDCAKQKGGDKK